MVDVYISIGSNINPEGNIKKCLDMLKSEFDVIAISPMYETKPYGYEKQSNFINLAAKIKTKIGAKELLLKLQSIEKNLGKKIIIKNGPRTIDLDILLYNSEIINEKGLIVPHKGLLERDFMLVPLLDIAPNIEHPLLKTKIKYLKKDIKYKQIIRKIIL